MRANGPRGVNHGDICVSNEIPVTIEPKGYNGLDIKDIRAALDMLKSSIEGVLKAYPRKVGKGIFDLLVKFEFFPS
jgi:hypothetical protein